MSVPPEEAQGRRVLLCCVDKMRGEGVSGRRKKSRSFDDSDCTISEYALGRLCDMGWDWRDADPSVFPQTSGTSEFEGTEKDEMKLMIANSVAALSLHVLAGGGLEDLMEVLSEKEYQGLFESGFRCVANAVFSIFDMDDFVRVHGLRRLSEEYTEFISGLNLQKSVANQTMECNTSSILREHDLFCALKCLQGQKEESGFKEEELWADVEHLLLIGEVSADLMEVADTVIKRCRSLKRDDRMRLSLEIMLKKRYIVYDTVVLRALCGIFTTESHYTHAVTSSDGKSHYGSEAARILSQYYVGIVDRLYALRELKSSLWKQFQEALIFPLLDDGIFGPCTEEVIEVIKFADFERRMQNGRFISSKEVLFCLSLTRVGVWVKLLLLEGNQHRDFSLFMLYKQSRKMACSGKYMTLDHMVMALFGKKNYKDIQQIFVLDDSGSSYLNFHDSRYKILKAHPPLSGDKVLHSVVWDGNLRQRLGLSGYEQSDVTIWNSFSKSLYDSDGLSWYTSHTWVTHVGLRATRSDPVESDKIGD